MFTISIFENGNDYAIEQIDNLTELNIDTVSSELQILRIRVAGGKLITRELNPLKMSLYIDEGDIL